MSDRRGPAGAAGGGTGVRPVRKCRRAVAILALGVCVAGCATVPPSLVYGGASQPDDGRLWPAPQSGEVPRYRYVGELTGEGNFVTPGGVDAVSFARRALAFIAGLAEKPVAADVLQRPQGGYTDAAGRVFVTDVSRRAVFVFDAPAGRLAIWEDAAPGERFEAPIAIAPGRDGEMLVTDADRGEVFRLSLDGRPVGRFGRGVLVRPTGIARDARTRRTYVADVRAHAVHVFDDEGASLGTLGSGGAQPAFNAPLHVALAADAIYVVDGLEATVFVVDENGRLRTTIGRRGLYVGNLVRPKGVAVDDEGNVYVVESMHDRLLVFDADGRLLMAIGGTGRDVGRFYLPAGVWVDTRNRVYVADMFNGRVVVFQFLGGS